MKLFLRILIMFCLLISVLSLPIQYYHKCQTNSDCKGKSKNCIKTSETYFLQRRCARDAYTDKSCLQKNYGDPCILIINKHKEIPNSEPRCIGYDYSQSASTIQGNKLFLKCRLVVRGSEEEQYIQNSITIINQIPIENLSTHNKHSNSILKSISVKELNSKVLSSIGTHSSSKSLQLSLSRNYSQKFIKSRSSRGSSKNSLSSSPSRTKSTKSKNRSGSRIQLKRAQSPFKSKISTKNSSKESQVQNINTSREKELSFKYQIKKPESRESSQKDIDYLRGSFFKNQGHFQNLNYDQQYNFQVEDSKRNSLFNYNNWYPQKII